MDLWKLDFLSEEKIGDWSRFVNKELIQCYNFHRINSARRLCLQSRSSDLFFPDLKCHFFEVDVLIKF